MLAGEMRAVARGISLVEARAQEREHFLRELHGQRGDAVPPALVIGITGPPGAGKSTLISQLIMSVRHTGAPVAVLAVDPSSPFTGGALLGDRIRMDQHGVDPGVFIRSMASRGGSGGLCAAAVETVQVLESAGYGTILVESVGVGQSEIGILTVADIVVVALTPGSGDEIQALKAGVMEIGDVYVVNKADHPQAEGMVAALRSALMDTERGGSAPAIVKTIATEGTGVAELYSTILSRKEQYHASQELDRRRRERVVAALRETTTELVQQRLQDATAAWGALPPEFSLPTFQRELDEFLTAYLGRLQDDSRN